MKTTKNMLARVMMILLVSNLALAQSQPTSKAIDLNTPAAKHQVADLIKNNSLCQANLATTTDAYKKCTAETAPPLSFWQKPLGMVVIGLIGAGVGALGFGYIQANAGH